jgi:hypothetical protein
VSRAADGSLPSTTVIGIPEGGMRLTPVAQRAMVGAMKESASPPAEDYPRTLLEFELGGTACRAWSRSTKRSPEAPKRGWLAAGPRGRPGSPLQPYRRAADRTDPREAGRGRVRRSASPPRSGGGGARLHRSHRRVSPGSSSASSSRCSTSIPSRSGTSRPRAEGATTTGRDHWSQPETLRRHPAAGEQRRHSMRRAMTSFP